MYSWLEEEWEEEMQQGCLERSGKEDGSGYGGRCEAHRYKNIVKMKEKLFADAEKRILELARA